MSPSRLRVTLALVVTVVLVADQLTKMWALSQLPGRVIPLAPTLELRLAYNSGFSFGMGATWGPVVAVGVLAVAALLARMALRERDTTRAVLLAAILGGALGNIVDRVFRADAGPLTGHVVDFIAVTWYAVFNVADMFVVCGALLLAVSELRRDRGTEAEPA